MERQSSPAFPTTVFRVGKLKCEMHFDGNGELRAEWSPRMPRKLSKKELRAYRAGRDAFFAEVAGIIGRPVLVLE